MGRMVVYGLGVQVCADIKVLLAAAVPISW